MMGKAAKTYADYTRPMRSLSGSQRQLRLRQLAEMLAAEVHKADGTVNRKELLAKLAARLNTAEAEVSPGIVLGEGLCLFERSPDGLLLQAV